MEIKIELDTNQMSLNFEKNTFEIPVLRRGSMLCRFLDCPLNIRLLKILHIFAIPHLKGLPKQNQAREWYRTVKNALNYSTLKFL